MTHIFRNLKSAYRRLINAKTVTLAGVTLCTDTNFVSREVRNGIFKGTYEKPECLLVKEFLQAGDKVLEVGGGVGFVSLLCSKICGAGNVLTYEANPAMIDVIRKNYELNGMNPNIRGRAITANGGEVTFYANNNIISSSLFQRLDGQKISVQSDDIKSAITDWHPTVLVMDIEGAEVEVLKSTNLPGVHKIILELHPHIVGDSSILDLKQYINQIGFREIKSIDKSVFYLRN